MFEDNSPRYADYDRLVNEYQELVRLCAEKRRKLRSLHADGHNGVNGIERAFGHLSAGVDDAASVPEDLSRRERQVLEAIGEGLTTPQVARKFELAISTVETYRERLKRKLQLDSGSALTRYAILWVNGLHGPNGGRNGA